MKKSEAARHGILCVLSHVGASGVEPRHKTGS